MNSNNQSSQVQVHIHDVAVKLVAAQSHVIVTSTAVRPLCDNPFATYSERMEALAFKFNQLISAGINNTKGREF